MMGGDDKESEGISGTRRVLLVQGENETLGAEARWTRQRGQRGRHEGQHDPDTSAASHWKQQLRGRTGRLRASRRKARTRERGRKCWSGVWGLAMRREAEGRVGSTWLRRPADQGLRQKQSVCRPPLAAARVWGSASQRQEGPRDNARRQSMGATPMDRCATEKCSELRR